MSSWTGLGIMSGSSLDGLDLCCAEFTGDYHTDLWSFRILKTQTIPYDPDWRQRLRTAESLSGQDLIRLHVDYGTYVGTEARRFIEDSDFSVNFVSSHGHTIFHQPDKRLTFQIGDGETMVAKLTCPLVTNFRNKDVALGGQGAPLVPTGENYLFSQYGICLNLGGISNISIHNKGFDVSVCNMLLNHLAERYDQNLKFDKDGDIARGGDIIAALLEKMNRLDYYKMPPPKSLGREWFDSNMRPLLANEAYKPQDLLRTAVEHITDQLVSTLSLEVGQTTEGRAPLSLLITGGGALNTFLMERLRDKIRESRLNVSVTQTDEDMINFKEALIFAFLGLRCLLGLPNISATVTGSSTDCVSGSVHMAPSHAPLGGQSSQDYRFHFRAGSRSGGLVPALKKRLDQEKPTSKLAT